MKPTHALDNALLTRKQIGELLGLRRTALKTALAEPDAPVPVVFNARVFRYRVSDVEAWVARRQGHRRSAPVVPANKPAASRRPDPARGPGRPRKHTISYGVQR